MPSAGAEVAWDGAVCFTSTPTLLLRVGAPMAWRCQTGGAPMAERIEDEISRIINGTSTNFPSDCGRLAERVSPPFLRAARVRD